MTAYVAVVGAGVADEALRRVAEDVGRGLAEHGTLSEVAFALKTGRPVVGYDTWELSKRGAADDGIVRASSAEETVAAALRLAGSAT